MKNKIFLIVIILSGFISAIYPQPTFRKAVFLHWSVGLNTYGPNGSSTSVPIEATAYNIDHGYTTAEDSVWMTSVYEYPTLGNPYCLWDTLFYNKGGDYIFGDYIDDYDITIIKTCYTNSGLYGWWYDGPQDTINYPCTFSIYNYQWHIRKILAVMEAHPDKFFVIWNLVPLLESETTPTRAANDNAFSTWMKDTLATGLDATYGDFPDNVYIFDVFHILDSSNYMPLSLSVSGSDNHLNAAGTELVAPLFVNEVFDAAINYETIIPVEVVEINSNTVTTYTLEQNYPNPFNPNTEINFTLAKSGNITLKVYDSLGSVVATLIDGFMESGKHSIKYNAKDSTSGIYFYRLKTDNFTSTRKMLLIK